MVTIWDPPVKSEIGFVILVVEILIFGYSLFLYLLQFFHGSERVKDSFIK